MLAEHREKYYISNTMFNSHISYVTYALSLIASAMLLRKVFALRPVALRNSALYARTLR